MVSQTVKLKSVHSVVVHLRVKTTTKNLKANVFTSDAEKRKVFKMVKEVKRKISLKGSKRGKMISFYATVRKPMEKWTKKELIEKIKKNEDKITNEIVMLKLHIKILEEIIDRWRKE